MNNSTPTSEQVATGMKIVAGLIAVVPTIKAVTGFYESDFVWMITMLAIAAVIYFVADRIG